MKIKETLQIWRIEELYIYIEYKKLHRDEGKIK